MKRPIRRVALYGYLGSGNLGNDASLETVLAWFQSSHPDVEVRCITIAPREVTARYGIPSVPLAWHASGQGGNRVREAFRRLLGRFIDGPRCYALVGSVDAVIVPGMGVLEEALRVRPWGLPLGLFLMAAACRLRGRPFVLLDVGAEWAANPITRWLYAGTVRLAAHVSYRDQLSAAAMARAGARDPDAVAPDLVFGHPTPTLTRPEPGSLVVGVMAYYGQKDDPVRGADVRRRYVATMTDAMTQLVSAGHQVVLVGGDRVDIDVARDVHAAVVTAYPDLPDNAVQVRESTTFKELTEEMMRAEVVIASRFHNLICALRLALPTVSVGYAAKSRHLMGVLGLDDYCQDIERLDASLLVAQVKAGHEERDVLAAQIWRGTSDYAHEVERLLERVAREALGLAAGPRAVHIHGGTDAWQST